MSDGFGMDALNGTAGWKGRRINESANAVWTDDEMTERRFARERIKPPFAEVGAPALGGRRKSTANKRRNDDEDAE